jgi:hypothetical protein
LAVLQCAVLQPNVLGVYRSSPTTVNSLDDFAACAGMADARRQCNTLRHLCVGGTDQQCVRLLMPVLRTCLPHLLDVSSSKRLTDAFDMYFVLCEQLTPVQLYLSMAQLLLQVV